MSTLRKPLFVCIVLAALAVVAWLLLHELPGSGSPTGDVATAPPDEAGGDLPPAAAGDLGKALPMGAGREEAAIDPSARGGCRVRGRVVTSVGGNPVGGVEVLALSRHPAFAEFEVQIRDFIEEGFWRPRPLPPTPEVLGRTLSLPDGTFELVGLKEGRVFLDARSASYYTRSYPGVRLARAEARDGVELLLSPGGRVKGKVVDAADQPVAEARVILRPSVSSFLAQITARAFRWLETRTDAEGHFDFTGVPPGEGWAITATAPSMALAQSHDLSVQPGIPTDVVLRGGRGAVLEGVVRRPDGQPAPGAYVGFAYLDIARILFSLGPQNPVRADAEGRFQLAHVGAGEVAVGAFHPDLALAPVQILPVVDGGRYELELELGLGYRVEGRVVDPEGKPVAGAVVTARTMEQPRGFDLSLVARLVRYEAVSDAEGRFALGGLLSDRFFLEANKEGFLPARKMFRREQDKGEIRLVLERGVFVSGTVLDDKDQPVTRFRVRGRRGGRDGMGLGPRWSRPTEDRPNPYTDRSPWLRGDDLEVADAEGRFRIGPLPPGKARIEVDAQGYVASDSRAVDLEAGKEPEPLVFHLAKGAVVSGRVVERGGGPVGDAQVTWRRQRERRESSFLPFQIDAEPEDLDFMAMDSTFGSRSVVTDASGAFELSGIAPGTIDITARHPGFAKGSVRGLEIAGSDRRGDVLIQLTMGGAIEGDVRGLDNKPVAIATIAAFSLQTGVVKSATTNAAGYYKIDGLTPGSYVVFKTKMDAELQSLFADLLGNMRLKSTTVREGRTSRVDIEDRVEGGVDVYGRVLAGGEPVARAMVTLLGQDRGGPLGVGVRTATADDQGNYQVAAVLPGSYVCQITRFGERRPEMASQPLTVPRDVPKVRIDLEFPSGEIAGVVVDAAGKPVAGVQVRAAGGDSQSGPGGLIGMLSEFGGASQARSDGQGAFRLRRLPPGTWKLRVEPRGEARELYGVAELPGVMLAAGQRLDGVRIILPLACTLEGSITDGLGQPVRDATVRAVAEGKSTPVAAEPSAPDSAAVQALMREFRHVTRTAADGKFQLRGVEPGTWTVTAEKKGLTAERAQTVRLVLGSNPPVTLRMVRSGRVYLRVLDLDGQQLARGRVRVLDSEGREVGGARSLMSVMASLFRMQKADGDTEWMDMGEHPPDTYTLEVTRALPDGKSEVRSVKRKLSEGEEARWELRMSDLVKD